MADFFLLNAGNKLRERVSRVPRTVPSQLKMEKKENIFFFKNWIAGWLYTPTCKKSHIGTGSLFLSYYHITLIERRFCLLTTESSMIRLSLSLLITFKRRMLFQVLNLNLKEDWAGRPRDRRSWQTHGRESRGGLEKDFQSVFSLALIRHFAFIFVYYERTVNFSRVGATNETSLDNGQ